MTLNEKQTSRKVAQDFVRFALGIRAIKLGEFTLKSGRISPYFFNAGLFNTGRALAELAKAYATILVDVYPELGKAVLFGPAYKGIPLVVATAVRLSMVYGVDVTYAFNRKEAKDHGEGGIVVGAPLQGKKVLIVDDVMTTGTSSGEAVEIIRANGGMPIGCVIAFDRQECGKESALSAVQEFQRNYNIPVRAATTLADLISVLEKVPAESGDDNIGEMLEKILAYRREYGVSDS